MEILHSNLLDGILLHYDSGSALDTSVLGHRLACSSVSTHHDLADVPNSFSRAMNNRMNNSIQAYTGQVGQVGNSLLYGLERDWTQSLVSHPH